MWLVTCVVGALGSGAGQSRAQLAPPPAVLPSAASAPPLVTPGSEPQPVAGGAPHVQDALPRSPLERRVADVAALFRADPGGYNQFFDATFRAKVPDASLTQIFAGYYAQIGRCTGTKLEEKSGANGGKFTFTFEKGYTVPVSLVVGDDASHLISGLLIGGPQKIGQTMAQIVDELKALPGRKSLLFARLSGNTITPLVAYNEKQPLALGSAFKLYILAELTREIEAGQRHWTDIVRLSQAQASLPSGTLQTWPDGAPVTLHTLATFMISISDNTATDTLLRTLGREEVESALHTAGHSQPGLNIPFLSTLELFRIKGDPQGQMAGRYEKADIATKRQLLRTAIPAIPRDKLSLSDKPSHIATLEWFASANDLARVMNYLRLHSATGGATPVRGILAVNPGLAPSKRWVYTGYKGGSEPGVLTMTFLLQGTNGGWYVLTGSWNNSDAPLEEARFIGLMSSALEIAPQS